MAILRVWTYLMETREAIIVIKQQEIPQNYGTKQISVATGELKHLQQLKQKRKKDKVLCNKHKVMRERALCKADRQM